MKGEVIKMLLESLKTLDINRIDLVDAVEISAYGRLCEAEFDALKVTAPGWLPIKLKELRREIDARKRDLLEKRLREIRARLQAMKPLEEKRTDAEAEAAEIEAQLAAQSQ